MTELTSGISDLIQRIKEDGVVSGETEKKKIIQAAQEEAKRMMTEAQNKADKLVADAKHNAESLKAQTEAELRMAVRDFVFSFQQSVKAQAIRPQIASHVAAALNDEGFLKDVLKGLLSEFLKNKDSGLQLSLSPEMKEKLGGFFSKQLSDGNELEITGKTGLTGFRFRKAGDSYTWDFSAEAIAAELARLVEPALRPFFDLSAAVPDKQSR